MEINVKECAFYNDKICKSPINKNCKECERIRIEHCYYKQLQQLKEDYAELLQRHNDSFEQFKALKEENDELKKLVESYRNNYNNSILKQGELVSKNGDIYNKYQQTKQKLEKIEECINTTCFDYVGMDMIYFKKELLEIIRGEE